jgi:hypothetical protein
MSAMLPILSQIVVNTVLLAIVVLAGAVGYRLVVLKRAGRGGGPAGSPEAPAVARPAPPVRTGSRAA